jgi:Kef-type K+ transport system membrane component KefB
MALSETADQRLNDMTSGVSELLVPFFLAGIGLHFDLSAFTNASTLGLAAIIVVAAVASKFLACSLGAVRMGKTNAMRVGVGMVPRGEVGMVVAQIGLNMGAMAAHVYGIIVFMSVATTLIAPPLIKLAFRQATSEEQEIVARLG